MNMIRLIHVPSYTPKKKIGRCRACNKDLATEQYLVSKRNNKVTLHYCVECAKRYNLI